jgi:hypothetical protein
MQAIFNAMIDDALAKWEGERGIRGTKHENTPLWKLSAQNIGKPNDGFRGLGPHPLGWFVLGFGPGSGAWDPTTHSDVYDTTLAYSTNSPWQQNFLIIELGRAVELGYAADKKLYAIKSLAALGLGRGGVAR